MFQVLPWMGWLRPLPALRLALVLSMALAWSACGGGGGGGTGSGSGSGGGATPTPTPTTYAVIFQAGSGGSLTGTTTQTIASGGTSSPVTAVPDPGYTFTGWSGSGFTSTATNPLSVASVTQNLTLTATFAPQQFTVTFAAGPGGSLMGTTSQTVIYGATTSAVTAVPNTGYTFTGWSGTGVTGTATNPLSVSGVTQNLTLTATFAPQQFTVTFQAGVGGTLMGSTSQTVNYGTTTSAVTAVPNTGYTFTGWSGSGLTSTTTNPLSVSSVAQNLTLTATFTLQQFTVTFQAGDGGSLTGATSQTVAYGTSTSAVTAIPDTGYTFTGWSGSGFTSSAANPITVPGVTQNLTLTATFAPQQFSVTFQAGVGGSLTGTTSQTVAYGASTSAVTAVPNTGNTFTGWAGSGFTSTVTNPLSVSSVTQNLTLTASFSPQSFTVTFQAGAGGTLTGTTSQTVTYGASTSAVTAVPNMGYTFTGWSGSGFTTTATNPLSVSGVTQNLTLTATFVPQQFTVTFQAGAGGTLTGTTSQTVAYGASTSAVTAVPNTGYTFTGWSGSGFTTTATNPLSVSGVTQNLTLTATFVPQQFMVTFQAGAGGTLTGMTSQTVLYGGTASPVTATPESGFSFLNWTGTGGSGSSSSNPLSVTNITSDLVITANFTTLYVVTFLAGPNGSLSGTTSQAVAAGGSCTPVTSVPNAGYGFVNWTGTGGFSTSTANPLTISNVNANMTLTANVGRLPVIGSFWATATTIGKGQAATLNWSGLSYFTSASIDNGGGAVLTPNGMVGPYPNSDTTYTLTATNAVGTVSSSVHITVIPPPVISSFTATPSNVAAGAATTLSWSVTGAVSLSINNGVGTVTGTSVDVIPPSGTTTTYTLTANSGYGTRTATTSVTSGPPVALSYVSNPVTYYRNLAITPNLPSNGGGPITSYTVSPALPLGLTLNSGTGAISGTPTAVIPLTSYVVRGTNAYGFTTMSLIITVNETPPQIAYPNSTYTFDLGVPVSIDPINTGGQVVSWAITPALPAGLSFNTSTGRISGTPSGLSSPQSYTITATNSGGTSSPVLTLAVALTPPHIAYGSGSYTFYLNVPITPLTPNNSGAAATSWSVAPGLPPGLIFDTSTGQISGTPSQAATAQAYTISATHAGGTGTTSSVIAVVVQPPVFSTQPWGLILSPGDIPTFSAVASGSGTLSYQWYRNGVVIPGAQASSYAAPAFSLADDGVPFTVVVSDAFGGSATSAPAVLSLFQDLGAWLTAHPTVAGALKWQVQAGDPYNYYIAPAEAQKLAWPAWSPSQQADLNQAYLAYVAWFNAGAQPISMVAGGTATDLTDRPTNIYSQVNSDASSTMVNVSPAYMWRLYTGHVAFSLMLELSHQLPWSVTSYNSDSLRWLFDSSTMAWLLPNGEFGLGTYPGANQPTLRANNRPRTEFTDPRWTYPWLKQAGILGGSRSTTIGGFLDYMRQNLYHAVGGADTFGSDYAVWQYRGYSPVSRIVQGTTDSRYPGLGTQHFTEGCHGSTGFLNAALRVVNIPVQPIWVCGHELVYFLTEDLYMDHADDPYNQVVRASSTPSLQLLIDSATWRSRFGTDETLNNWDYASPAAAWIGYTAVHFP